MECEIGVASDRLYRANLAHMEQTLAPHRASFVTCRQRGDN